MGGSGSKSCFKCGERDAVLLEDQYGYTVCQTCLKKMGLFRDETIMKYRDAFQQAKKEDPANCTYEEEVEYRLGVMEKDYISKRIKLLHIRDRLRDL